MESRIIKTYRSFNSKFANRLYAPLWGAMAGLQICLFSMSSCGTEAPPMSQAITNRDSLPVMITYGVSKLISDSGIVQYKVVSEEWHVFDKTVPERQEFPKGIFLERYNKKFDVIMHITADTAYCYNQNLWELRGRIFVRNTENGTTFSSDELYWDMNRHWMYSNKPMHIVTPDRDLRGDRFESNEQLTKYKVWQTNGFVPIPEKAKEGSTMPQDTTQTMRKVPTSTQRTNATRQK